MKNFILISSLVLALLSGQKANADVVFNSKVDDDTVKSLIKDIETEYKTTHEPVRVYFNSPGGHLTSLMKYYDWHKHNPDIKIHGFVSDNNQATSAACVMLLMSEKVYVSEYSKIGFHMAKGSNDSVKDTKYSVSMMNPNIVNVKDAIRIYYQDFKDTLTFFSGRELAKVANVILIKETSGKYTVVTEPLNKDPVVMTTVATDDSMKAAEIRGHSNDQKYLFGLPYRPILPVIFILLGLAVILSVLQYLGRE